MRAQSVLGSVVHPVTFAVAPADELPRDALNAEVDLDGTAEEYPLTLKGKGVDVLMEYQVHRRQPVILSVDTSLSMTGEKLALTAVALAVVLLQFPDDPVGIVAFENDAKVLKAPTERISIDTLLERFLDVPAQGYTHLEAGLALALRLSRESTLLGRGRPASTVVLTDGKYTAGKDPGYLAPRFPHLVVLKMGDERASQGLCEELARKGRGSCHEVGELAVLPHVMYEVVKGLLRGRA